MRRRAKALLPLSACYLAAGMLLCGCDASLRYESRPFAADSATIYRRGFADGRAFTDSEWVAVAVENARINDAKRAQHRAFMRENRRQRLLEASSISAAHADSVAGPR